MKTVLFVIFQRMYFVRYCPDPLIVMLNPAFDGQLKPIEYETGQPFTVDDVNYQIVMNRDVTEIQSMWRNHGNHTLSLGFSPAFPNIAAFTGNDVSGLFEISGDPSTGLIQGEYRLIRSGELLTIELIPTGGWLPNERKLSLRFLYAVEPMFKEWPKTYRWSADIRKSGGENLHLTSCWERIKSE